jgi:2-oxoglutarate dehydrogenase E2 component (dihydrolipoamide succinyltransferase)
VKVLASKDGPVIGVHMVGERVGELIAEAQLITNWEALPSEVAQLIHPHPTMSEAVGRGPPRAGRQAPPQPQLVRSPSPMAVSVTMPRLGESVSEGTVTRWLKKEGERVEADEPLLEVSTDKVDTEIPVPRSRVVSSIKVQEDETVEVGVELATIDDGAGGGGEAPAAEAAPSPEAAPEPERRPSPRPSRRAGARAAGRGPSPSRRRGPLLRPSRPRPAPRRRCPQQESAPAAEGSGRGRVRHAARAQARGRARRRPVLAAGHRRRGRIRKQDVLDAAGQGEGTAAAAPAPPPAAAPPPLAPPRRTPRARAARRSRSRRRGLGARAGVRRPGRQGRPDTTVRGTTEPMSRLRKVIAQRMVESLQVSAQLTTVVEVDVTRIARLRAAAKATFEAREGTKLSFLPFFALATVEALKAHPVVNASIDQAAGTVTYHEAEHLASPSTPSAACWCRSSTPPATSTSPAWRARSPTWRRGPAPTRSPPTSSAAAPSR